MLHVLVAMPVINFAGAETEVLTMSDDGLVTIASNHPVKETLDRLEVDLRAKNITVFARIDHAAGAASVAMPLRPTELLIFGSPKAGTPLMQSKQMIGIDLPLKMHHYDTHTSPSTQTALSIPTPLSPLLGPATKHSRSLPQL